MRKVLLLLFLFICKGALCQIPNIRLLLGSTEPQVTKYFDSLNALRPNPSYKIKKDLTKYGDLMYEIEFSLNDEEYYNCIAIWAVFKRVNEAEMCTSQSIFGSSKYGESNVAFIKDHFKFVSDNRWEYLPPESSLKFVATLNIKNDADFTSYTISYKIDTQ